MCVIASVEVCACATQKVCVSSTVCVRVCEADRGASLSVCVWHRGRCARVCVCVCVCVCVLSAVMKCGFGTVPDGVSTDVCDCVTDLLKPCGTDDHGSLPPMASM